MQYHIPIELPDESLYGLIARFVRINGESHLKGCNAFLGNNQHSISDACTLENSAGIYKSDDRQTSQTPLVFDRLQRRLGGEEGAFQSLLKASFGEQHYWRYCELCCDAEIEEYGVAYWHLEHQITTTLVCHKHQRPLSEIRHKKKNTHQHLWLIEESLHLAKHFDALYMYHWAPIAKIGHDALKDTSEILDTHIIVGTILTALQDMGLVDTKDKLKISSFEFAFRTYFHIDFENELIDRLGIKKPRYLLSGIFDKKPNRTLSRLILIYWLFGSWEYFKSCCNWYLVFNRDELHDQKSAPEKHTVESLFIKIRDENRTACLSYVGSTDFPNRPEFARLFYKKFTWLLNNDRTWLSRVLPLNTNSQQLTLDY